MTNIRKLVVPASAAILMMVLGAANDWDLVNAHPEPIPAALLADAEPFYPARTPVLHSRAREVSARFIGPPASRHLKTYSAIWVQAAARRRRPGR